MKTNTRAGSVCRLGIVTMVMAAGMAVGTPARADIVETQANILDFRTGRIDTRAEVNLLDADAAFTVDKFYVLQLDAPLDAQRQATLEQAGVKLGQYLPNYAYITKLEKTTPAALRELGFVSWVGTMNADWKIDPQLGIRPIKDFARVQARLAGNSSVCVVLHENASAIDAVDEINAAGGQVLDIQVMDADTYIDAVIPTIAASQIASVDSVMFIEEAAEISQRNDSNRWIAQSNVNAQTPVWNAGIQGQGQIGGHIDGPPQESHCMFDDAVAIGATHRKIIAMRGGAGSDFHGTHTAGTLAGDNATHNTYTTNDGLAFRAKLSCTNLGIITSSNLETNLNAAYTDGARAHTNSWGDDGTTAYTSHCRQIDNHSFLKEDSLVLFAVTNLSTLKTPENAKNCVGVGASNDSASQGSICSGGAGPTNDGRRKPEAFLPGCNTTSASPSACSVSGSTGTSMACPAVTGAALLVRQYFTDGFYPTGAAVGANAFNPSSALVKGTLLNSCVDMSPAGYPSNAEGWGRVLLDNALYFPGNTSKLIAHDVRNANGFTTGQSTNYTFNVNSNGAPLKITLVWTEPAAAVNANPAYINDINLTVTDPSSNVYKGNVFTSNQSSTGGVYDNKNNVEMVLRTTPAVGQYSVDISALVVNAANKQGYALVITGDVSTCSGPSITDQPDALTVEAGDPANFSVTATGTGLNYQWKHDGNDVGGNAPNLSIPAATPDDAGFYWVVITGSCGQATSAQVLLTVDCPADFDNSGFVDTEDYDAFVAAFEAGTDDADFDGSGFVDTEDFDAFVQAFEDGC